MMLVTSPAHGSLSMSQRTPTCSISSWRLKTPVSHHFAHNDLLLADDATAFSHSFLLGGAVLRHNTSTQLNGENSTLRINSLAMPVKNEVCDTRTWLEHNKGFCNSRQLHKTIVSDKGRAVFNGLINVAQHAHQNGWSDDQQ
ncbi:cysteine desulfurase activator complex subunit SufD [Escherichia coli]|uniref:Cysteine desulfurase activator complex subunit SufD n=1 Tax=Escherichia coli TaxID=562 RepID=A0A376UB21_ECOLX|nr:cysteine desulfurase activator complex subunit SufD [Escherichia coli]